MSAAVWEYPTTLAAVLIALATIGKSAHWVYKWAQRIDDSLSYIEAEMRFNGGATLRDAVKRIEGQIGHIEQHQASRTGAVADVASDVATLLEHDATRDTEGKRYGTEGDA